MSDKLDNRLSKLCEAAATFLTTTCLAVLILCIALVGIGIARGVWSDIERHSSDPYRNLSAVLIQTNLCYRPCPCGFCRPSEGIAVPEHINTIGYDLVYKVSTNYLPLVVTPPTPTNPPPLPLPPSATPSTTDIASVTQDIITLECVVTNRPELLTFPRPSDTFLTPLLHFSVTTSPPTKPVPQTPSPATSPSRTGNMLIPTISANLLSPILY